MNIKNLKEGMQFKNYKVLCEFLEMEIKDSTCSKNAQLKELSRYCEFHKEGQKFIIDEIYSEVKDKVDKRGGGNNKTSYIEYIEKLILDLLVQNLHKEKVCLSKNKLFKELKMTNGNYAFCKSRVPKLSQFLGIEKELVEEWISSTDTTLKGNLERALDNLKTQSLILWTSEISVCKIDIIKGDGIYEINKNITLDEYDEEIVEIKVNVGHTYNFREATESEKKFIIHTEREVMKDLKFESKQKIVQCGMWDVFKKKVNAIVIKELNIDYYFDSYKILFNQDHICEKYEELLDLLFTSEERKVHQQELNKAIIERLYGNSIKKQNRALKETENTIGQIKDEKLKRRVSDTYLDDNEKLINNLINKDFQDIKRTIKKLKLKTTK